LLGQRLATIVCCNPSGLRPVLGHSLAEAGNHLDKLRDISRLPTVLLSDLVDEGTESLQVTCNLFPQTTHAISFVEALALGILLRKVKAQRVFEIGTNRGVSTTQLTLNLGPSGQVFTLDLPKENRQTAFALKIKGDIEVAHQLEKADLIPDLCRSRVVFLEEDSATFDVSPYAETMDAVFVDGAHTYEYVRNDSEKSWRMLRPGGIVVWHDYRPQFPDVMRYLIESNYSPRRIEGTALAFAVKPG